LIQLYTVEFNELVPYWNSNQIPGNIKDNFDIPLSEIPKSLKSLIFRRLNPSYYKYL